MNNDFFCIITFIKAFNGMLNHVRYMKLIGTYYLWRIAGPYAE
jgi:hypothetical protein